MVLCNWRIRTKHTKRRPRRFRCKVYTISSRIAGHEVFSTSKTLLAHPALWKAAFWNSRAFAHAHARSQSALTLAPWNHVSASSRSRHAQTIPYVQAWGWRDGQDRISRTSTATKALLKVADQTDWFQRLGLSWFQTLHCVELLLIAAVIWGVCAAKGGSEFKL